MLGMLAVLGTVGGAWGGQWIAARSDDKRWKRELDREKTRWKRERERIPGAPTVRVRPARYWCVRRGYGGHRGR